tara:strand:- start:310 stop:558 length:249 start_codon:yes stop_codon:yes gene_type:complete
MEKKKLAKDLKHILKIEFDIDQSLITNDTNLLSTGIIDSHNLMEFILLIEKRYKIKINPMKISLDKLVSIEGIIYCINKLKK